MSLLATIYSSAFGLSSPLRNWRAHCNQPPLLQCTHQHRRNFVRRSLVTPLRQHHTACTRTSFSELKFQRPYAITPRPVATTNVFDTQFFGLLLASTLLKPTGSTSRLYISIFCRLRTCRRPHLLRIREARTGTLLLARSRRLPTHHRFAMARISGCAEADATDTRSRPRQSSRPDAPRRQTDCAWPRR
mgnify:FL=1